MPKQFMQMGPWPGGVNQRDDPAQIADYELADAVNFDIEDTGVLLPRRGWTTATPNGTVARLLPLTVYYDYYGNPQAVFSQATNTAAGSESTKFFKLGRVLLGGPNPTLTDLTNASAAVITRTGLFATAFALNKKIYFVPDWRSTATPVGFWLPDVAGGSNPTDVATMPKGEYSFVINDRAFIFNPFLGTLYWSKATDPTNWTAPDGGYVEIDPQDEPFTDCVVARNTAYFIRGNGIYVFTFTSDPGIDGQITMIANKEGALKAAVYQNDVYLATTRGLFKLVNGYLALLSDKVDLGIAPNFNSYGIRNGMTVIDHTLWIMGLNSAGNMVHTAFNLRTGAASRYSQTNLDDLFGKGISDSEYTYINANTTIAMVQNKRSSTATTANGKSFAYSFTTKRSSTIYSPRNRRPYSSRLLWKRLISWLTDFNVGSQFADGNNSHKFFVRVNANNNYRTQDTYVGSHALNGASVVGRVDTPSVRYKDFQFGLQSTQMGYTNPSGTGADAGMSVRSLAINYSVSRDIETAEA